MLAKVACIGAAIFGNTFGSLVIFPLLPFMVAGWVAFAHAVVNNGVEHFPGCR